MSPSAFSSHKKVSLTKKCLNHRPTHGAMRKRHSRRQSHDSKNTIKVKQPALSSSAGSTNNLSSTGQNPRPQGGGGLIYIYVTGKILAIETAVVKTQKCKARMEASNLCNVPSQGNRIISTCYGETRKGSQLTDSQGLRKSYLCHGRPSKR